MASTLIVKILSGISGYNPLTGMLGSPPRVYPLQLPQGAEFPAMTMQVVSNGRTYSVNNRLSPSQARVQFNIFGASPGGENARAVESALCSFLDQFNAIGVSGLQQYPNRVVNSREFGIAATSPETFQIIVDAFIFDSEVS